MKPRELRVPRPTASFGVLLDIEQYVRSVEDTRQVPGISYNQWS
jgi:hypothetical protein